MHRIAAQTFQQNLEGEMGERARDYLHSRQIGGDTARQFGLGVSCSSGRQLLDRLERFGPEFMEASGLFIRGRDGLFQERFRGRLMLPIQNASGETVAFGARQLAERSGAKYINSPSTEIYQKSAALYNVDRASRGAAQKRRVVVVEGYLDVIAAHQAGVRNVVAVLSEQAGQLKQCASEVVLNFESKSEWCRRVIQARSTRRLKASCSSPNSLLCERSCWRSMPKPCKATSSRSKGILR
jgi:DNA primase